MHSTFSTLNFVQIACCVIVNTLNLLFADGFSPNKLCTAGCGADEVPRLLSLRLAVGGVGHHAADLPPGSSGLAYNTKRNLRTHYTSYVGQDAMHTSTILKKVSFKDHF